MTAQVAAAGRESDAERSRRLSLVPLIALVVGSMIGGGVFNLPSDMSRAASPGAIAIGWLISGMGMLMLALVYQGLALRKPRLDAGPYAYAKAGFGTFVETAPGDTGSAPFWATSPMRSRSFQRSPISCRCSETEIICPRSSARPCASGSFTSWS